MDEGRRKGGVGIPEIGGGWEGTFATWTRGSDRIVGLGKGGKEMRRKCSDG